MLRRVRRFGAASMLALLCGCVAVGKIDQRATRLNEQVADSSNQGLLMNIARASHEEPIYFMAFNQLAGSGTTDFKLGAPQFFIGPHLPAADEIATFGAQGSIALDNQTNTNFQVSVLGSKDFYNGLMGPLDLRDVDLLLHQGYSRELIFYLVIEKAKITVIPDPGQKEQLPIVVYNDPRQAASFRLFQTYIGQAMVHGLTTETYEVEGAPQPEDDSGSGGNGGGKKHGPPPPTIEAELCYDKALADPTDLPHIPAGSFCGDKPAKRQYSQETSSGAPLFVTLNGQKLQIDVTTRSIYEIFYYLGRIVAAGQEVDLQPFALPAETIAREPLMDVRVGPDARDGGCFSTIVYEHQRFCVPIEGAQNTKRIFGILNALLALKQSAGDLPTTQTVRVAQ
jgi:hypothetical protein